MHVTITWQEILRLTGQHVQLVVVASILAVLIGVPIGFIVTRPSMRYFAPLIIGTANVLQTVPSLAIIALALPLLGVGFKPALVALFAYGLLPIVRNTYAGVNNIDHSIIEAAVGMGMTKKIIFHKIEMPLAAPVILAGVRTSVVISVGTATLASLIGGGGLGDLIITGLDLRMTNVMLAGAIPTALLAMFVEGFLGKIEWFITPRGVRQETY